MRTLALGMLTFYVGFSSSFAQSITLNTTDLNSNNGLSQNSIQCILKDSYGFMWFGTQDGLNKYDGIKFTIYKHSQNKPASLPANMVNTVCQDADHNLWAGTRLGGLSRYDRANDSFINYQNNSADPSSLSNNSIHIIYKDRRSNLWIGTDSGLNLFNKKTGKFRRYFHNNQDHWSLSNSAINSLYEDANHNFWVGTANGLNLLNRETGKCTRFFDKQLSLNGNNNAVNAIVEDDDRNVWIGTGKGLDLVDIAGLTYSYYAIDPDKNLSGAINSVMCLKKTSGNKFWIGSNTTLQLFDAGKKRLIPVSKFTNGESLMPDDGISALCEDNAGILWIGTTSTGVHKYDRNLSIFPSYKASLNNNPSATNIIRSITEDQKGDLYLGTDIGIECYDRVTGTYTSYRHNKADASSLAGNYTLTVLASKKNNLVWVGTYANGLDCLNPATKKFSHIKLGKGLGKIDGKGIYALIEDRQGNIWFGPDGGGVYEYNPVDKKFTRYIHDDKNINSVCDNSVQTLYEDRQGNIWMGGYTYGISVFNPKTKRFKQINSGNSGLSNNVISAFCEDSAGNMWIGTMEGGLNCYQAKSHTFKTYSEANRLVNNTINYISTDKNGYIWMSTIQGIVQFDPIHQYFKNYGYHNGLKSLEFNFGTGATLHTGEIVFGSINGFSIVDPAHLYADYNKPVVAITGFELFDKPVMPGAKDSPLKQSIATTREIVLNHSQSIFSIDFAALDYTIPENNIYAYKLEGFDDDWRYAGTERKATYTNLDPGNYVFKVIAANEDGVWSGRETLLVIKVIPPYWMTWWFRLLCMLAITGIAYGIYLNKMSFIKNQEIELKKQVKLRTLEIAEQADHLQKLNNELQHQKEEVILQSQALHEKTDSLEQLNEELKEQKAQEEHARLMAEKARQEADKANKAKSTFLATMSHEIRTPLNGVVGMAALLAETEQTREQYEYTSAIIKSSDSLLLVINDILDFSKIESGNLTLDPHEFNLRKCIDDILSLFAYKATEIGIKLHFDIDRRIPANIIADSLRLRQVLTNLVGNAVKFTHKGEIAVNVKLIENEFKKFDLLFVVKDTGIGIKEEKIGNLFQAFNQVDSSITRRYGGSGLGLVISDRLIKLMGGKIIVESCYGVGSTFTFTVKCDIVPVSNDVTLNDDQNVHKIKLEEKKSLLSEQFALNYPLSILVAEDNVMNQKLLLRILNKLGYKADLANDGVEVLANLTERSYDVILMDVQMPNMDGLEATRAIRKIYGQYPLISAMTANALSEDKENCMAAGMNDYMSKPISIETLLDKLTELFKLVQQYKFSGDEKPVN